MDVPKELSPVEQAALRYTGQKVVLVTDVHSNSDHILKFSKDFLAQLKAKEQGGDNIALEILGPGEVPLIDAFAKGEISRADFVAVLNVNHPDTVEYAGTMSDYLGKERAEIYFNEIADLVEAGVKVHCVGTSFGMSSATSDFSVAQKMDSLSEAQGYYTVELLKFSAAHREEIETDPRVFFENYMTKIEGEMQGREVSEEQQQLFTFAVQSVREKETTGQIMPDDYKNGITKLFKSTSENFRNVHILTQDPALEGVKPTVADDNEDKDFDVEKSRQAADGYISEKIIKVARESQNLVVLYGALHSNHKADIDGNLREAGYPTLIFDIDNIPKPIECNSFCENSYLTEQWLKNSIRRDNDPDRHTVHLDGGKEAGKAVEPVKSWTIIDTVKQGFGL